MKLFPILALVLLASCSETNVPKEPTGVTLHDLDLSIVEVDGCEYLFAIAPYHSVLTHKGNCKYCAHRAQE